MLYEKLTKKEQIIRMYKTGMRQIDIAKAIRVNTTYVWKVVDGLKSGK